MAGVSVNKDFVLQNETAIEQLKNCSKKPNTFKSTPFWLNIWKHGAKRIISPTNLVNTSEPN